MLNSDRQPSPSATSPRPPLSLAQTLPSELILLILEQAVADRTPSGFFNRYDEAQSVEQEVKLFNSSSLVCRSWREPGQMMMWRRVCVVEELRCKPLVESPLCGVYQTVSLVMIGPDELEDGVDDEAAMLVLAKLRGLKSLELSGFRPLSMGWLENPALGGLTHLTVEASSFRYDGNALTLPDVPFNLHSLNFQMIVTPDPSIPRFFSRFVNPSLTTVTLHPTRGLLSTLEVDDLALFLRLVGPQLTESSVIGGALVLNSLGIFESLTSLRVLHLTFREESVLEHVKAKLDTLVLHHNIHGHELVSRMKAILPFPCLERLRTIRLPHGNRDKFVEGDGAKELVESLQKRGIKLVFGVG